MTYYGRLESGMQGGPGLPLGLPHPQQVGGQVFGKTEAQPRYGGLLEGSLLSHHHQHHQQQQQQQQQQQHDLMPKFDFSHCVVPKFEPKFEVSTTSYCTRTVHTRNRGDLSCL